jgi:hypothetical protein
LFPLYVSSQLCDNFSRISDLARDVRASGYLPFDASPAASVPTESGFAFHGAPAAHPPDRSRVPDPNRPAATNHLPEASRTPDTQDRRPFALAAAFDSMVPYRFYFTFSYRLDFTIAYAFRFIFSCFRKFIPTPASANIQIYFHNDTRDIRIHERIHDSFNIFHNFQSTAIVGPYSTT